jgi:RNA polymerase sigma-70 factor (subfamily 1)
MSANTGADPEYLLLLARAGSGPALGQLLELYRNYLALLVRVQIGRRLQGKADSADLVQETFLEATEHFDQFRGTSEAELAAWLRQILVSRLARLVRHYCSTQRRDIRLDIRLARGADRGELSWRNTAIFRHGCLSPALAKGRPKKSKHSCQAVSSSMRSGRIWKACLCGPAWCDSPFPCLARIRTGMVESAQLPLSLGARVGPAAPGPRCLHTCRKPRAAGQLCSTSR